MYSLKVIWTAIPETEINSCNVTCLTETYIYYSDLLITVFNLAPLFSRKYTQTNLLKRKQLQTEVKWTASSTNRDKRKSVTMGTVERMGRQRKGLVSGTVFAILHLFQVTHSWNLTKLVREKIRSLLSVVSIRFLIQ